MSKTVNIPNCICQLAIEAKFVNPCATFITLKSMCSGKIRLSEKDMQVVADTMGVRSGRTVRNHLEKLMQRGWVSYHKASKYYFIKSFERVINIEGLKGRTVAPFDLSELLNLRAFILSAPVGYLVNSQARKAIKRQRDSEGNKLMYDSSKTNLSARFTSYPVSNTALARCLHTSRSTARRIKQKGKEAKYLSVEKTSRKAYLPSCLLDSLRIAFPDQRGKIISGWGGIVILMPDMVSHDIKFKTKNFRN